MKYRAEIDGLRALAVIPVVLFHAGFDLFSGGYIGVDIFFVISGYLITSILIGEMQRGEFSLASFYERRARRILPALFFVVLVCIPFAWFLLLPADLLDFFQSIVAVVLFGSNILFWFESGYFATASELKPLLHTWSLAVEEQYYILYPLLLLLLYRFGLRWLVIVLALGFVVSLGIAEWTAHAMRSAGFYLLPARGWELLLGCFAALYLGRGKVMVLPGYAVELLTALGLGMILVSIVFFDHTTPSPGLITLLPTLGTLLIILFANDATRVGNLLANRWLVGVGLLSYSAYLWHQPVFAFARHGSLGEPGALLMSLLALASFFLAYLSWQFVEKPFRTRQKFSSSVIFGVSFLVGSVLAGIGFFGQFRDGFPERLDARAQLVAGYASDSNPYQQSCLIRSGRVNGHPLPGCTDFFVDGDASVMLIGDSHSDAISYQVQRLLHERGIGSYAVAYLGCVGLPGFTRMDVGGGAECHQYNTQMLQYARKLGVSTLVVTSRFPFYYHGERFDNGKGGVEPGPPIELDVLSENGFSMHEGDRKQRLLDGFEESLRMLLKEFRVVLVYPIPEAGWSVPSALAKSELMGLSDEVHLVPYRLFEERAGQVVNVFDDIKSSSLYRVRPADIFCKSEYCSTVKDGLPLYYDDDHLASSTGATMIAPLVVEEVELSLNDESGGRH